MKSRERSKKNFFRPMKVVSRKKPCRFCVEKEITIDYKDPRSLSYYTSEKGKILAARITGTCAKHQRHLAIAIKRARQIALMSYTGSEELY